MAQYFTLFPHHFLFLTIAFQPSLDLAVVGAVVCVGVGLLAGIVPGWQAAHTEIVIALRQA